MCANLFPLITYIIDWLTGIYFYIKAGLAQEIATSPIALHGRSAQLNLG